MSNDAQKRDSTQISFSFSAPPTKKRRIGSKKKPTSLFDDDNNDETPKGEVILSISENTITPAVAETKEEPLVIPLPADINAGKIGIKRNQDHLILARIARGEDIEMEDAKDEKDPDDFDGEIIESAKDDIDSDLPLLLRNRKLELETIEDEDERFRADISSRPESASLEDYQRVPIEKFGEALLRGMHGWKPGMKIGLNGRGLEKPVEITPRPRGLGLGALATGTIKKGDEKKNEKQSETKNEKRSETRNEKQKKEEYSKKYREKEDSSRKRSSDTRKEKESQSKKERKEKDSKSRRNCWMHPGITVRIVSKSFKSGKYFCKRAQIIDVWSSDQCTVRADGNILEGVKQRMIETALPKPGGSVMIVQGKNTGRIGLLKSRHKNKNEAVVQHDDDLSIRSYNFDDVAEYTELRD